MVAGVGWTCFAGPRQAAAAVRSGHLDALVVDPTAVRAAGGDAAELAGLMCLGTWAAAEAAQGRDLLVFLAPQWSASGWVEADAVVALPADPAVGDALGHALRRAAGMGRLKRLFRELAALYSLGAV